MKYHIIKPKSVPVDKRIIAGIKESDDVAIFVDNGKECDVAVLQKGCTRSKICVAEIKRLRDAGKPLREGNVYYEKYFVHQN